MPLDPPLPDTGDAITTAENTLRELIEMTLASQPDWLDQSGLTAERINLMRARRTEESARRQGGVIEQRLLLYSDLTDLKTIIGKKWSAFKACFDDKKTFDVYMDRLVDLRTAQMHGRALLPFERHLVAGISGEFRNRVTILRGGQGPDREYFARIEYVRDSFGNTRRGHGSKHEDAQTGLTLRPGDVVVFDCTAWDPEGARLSWRMIIGMGGRSEAFEGNTYAWTVADADIAESAEIRFYLTSTRPYHRHSTYDDALAFGYRILPRS